MSPKTKLDRRSEQSEQQILVEYLRLRKLLFTSTLGGVRLTIGQAVKIKRQGYSKGVPDVIIFEPSNGYHGLAIEMKKEKGGVTSQEQKEWIQGLNDRGYKAVVCKGAGQAIDEVIKYLK